MTLTVDTRAFQAALRKHLAQTSRELSNAINMRMAYVNMRALLILEPKDPQAKRNSVRNELTAVIAQRFRTLKSGKAKIKGKAKQFQVRHRLLQWIRARKGQPGLYGDQMRIESGKFLRNRVSSVGAMKAAVVIAIRKFMPSFTQFGSATKKSGGRQVKPNAALVAMAKRYLGGGPLNNVGVNRNSKTMATIAKPGFSPTATALISIGVNDDQVGRVEQRYHAAYTRAFADETQEMLNHIATAAVP